MVQQQFDIIAYNVELPDNVSAANAWKANTMTDAMKREIDFGMFVIYRLAESWGMTAADVYRVLSETGTMANYIIPFYDVLHTQGTEYLVEDITEYVRKRGVSV